MATYRPTFTFNEVFWQLVGKGYKRSDVVDAMLAAVPSVLAHDWTDDDIAATLGHLQARAGQDTPTRQDTGPDTGPGGPPRHGMTGEGGRP